MLTRETEIPPPVIAARHWHIRINGQLDLLPVEFVAAQSTGYDSNCDNVCEIDRRPQPRPWSSKLIPARVAPASSDCPMMG